VLGQYGVRRSSGPSARAVADVTLHSAHLSAASVTGDGGETVVDQDDEADASGCVCECESCQAGDCSSCTHEACDAEAEGCEGCGMASSADDDSDARAEAEARQRRLALAAI
jgi:hypothetical protein